MDTLYPFFLNVIFECVFVKRLAPYSILMLLIFHARPCCFLLCGVCFESLFSMVLSVGLPYFTKVVQLLCSISGWLHLNCSSIGTGFNGAETSCRIALNFGILLMNSNCFAFFFSSILVMSVQISI